jgi:excisionase family DNA binding protein
MVEITDPEQLLTSAEVARMLQVDATSVINWSKKGYLNYYRTPGGHRRIRAADVVEFARQRGMPVPMSLDGISQQRVIVAETDAKQGAQWKKAFESQRRVVAVYVQSTAAALVELGTFKPHLLILDNALDGLATAELIKKKTEYRALRIVLVCDRLVPEIQRRATLLGVECIARPDSVAMAKVTENVAA